MARNKHAKAPELLAEVAIKLIDVIAIDLRNILKLKYNLSTPECSVHLIEEIQRLAIIENQVANEDSRISPALLAGEV